MIILPGYVQLTALHMDTLGSAADTQHDLPRCVLLIKVPPVWTLTRVAITRVVSLQLVIKRARGLPVGVSVRNIDSKLQHLLGEVILVVAQWTIEEMSPRILRSLLNTTAMEPSATTRCPQELFTLSILQLHGTASALFSHLLSLLIPFVGIEVRLLNWFVTLAEGCKVFIELLKTVILNATGKMERFPEEYRHDHVILRD